MRCFLAPGVLLSGALLSALPTPARADNPSPELRAHALEDEARAAAAEGRLAEAASSLKRAWALEPSSSIACNLGRVQASRGDMPEAAEFLSRCVEAAPPVRTGEEEERYKRTLERLAKARAAVVGLAIEVNEPDADVNVDGQRVGTSPLRRVVFVEPGPHRVVATRDGFAQAAADVTGAKGDVIDVTLTLAPLSPPPRAVVDPSAPPALRGAPAPAMPARAERAPVFEQRKPAVIALGSGAGATAAAGIAFSVATAWAHDDMQGASAGFQERYGRCWPEGCGAPDKEERHAAMKTLAVTSFVVSGALTVAAAFVGIWPRASSARAARGPVTVATW